MRPHLWPAGLWPLRPQRRLRLFQYWDSATPPADVLEWTSGFRKDNPDFEHVLFSRASGERFIRRYFGRDAVAAFRACAVPAMQADLIRLFALVKHGGVYIDVDHQSRKPLRGLIREFSPSAMFLWLGLLNNALLVFPEPDNPFLVACLHLALENVIARRYTSAFMSTGPGVFNAVRAAIDPNSLGEIVAGLDDPSGQAWNFTHLLERARNTIKITPQLKAAYSSIRLVNPIAATIWIGMDQPDYKLTECHWTRWKGSIYT